MKIEVKQLTKVYKDKKALNNISFSLEEPKIYGLLGRMVQEKQHLWKFYQVIFYQQMGKY